MSNMIEIELIIFTATDLAIMVGREDVDELDEIWLPKRAIECADGFDLKPSSDAIPILLPEALALKKGLL
ncbi:MAG: hypothetical protein JKX72_05830 [Robiginitomaculum sp.]|nr:hypothetical protein [Robiginitomaculum sp.]